MIEYKDPAEEKSVPFALAALSQIVVYFLATVGFSNYVLNTALFKKTGWVDDSLIPGTMTTGYIVPGLIIAATYIAGGREFDMPTLVVCIVSVMAGSFFGARSMLAAGTAVIRKVIGITMIISMAALVFRLCFSPLSGETGLHGFQFAVAVPLIFVLGFVNNFGVPMKPGVIAAFLLMGVSPLATLTYCMAMGIAGPLIGCVRVFRAGRYNRRFFWIMTVFGSAGALAGCFCALSVSAAALTPVMLLVMGFVAYTMLRKNETKI